MKYYANAIVLLTLGLLAACDRPDCVVQNQVYSDYQPSDQRYKKELARDLELNPEATYWFNSYKELQGKEFLIFDIRGDGPCAQLELTVIDWDGLEGVREKKGVSYRGAEFRNLQFEIVTTPQIEFVYRSIDHIID